ncbi:hypothetical protein ACFVVX_23140 [Kitasatospora sp. NPDC058170]|uniref:hypothetical protein n=1 Tax=Kitasatospora sp. NPDC058170 TaxID=3346364 RepID=UPI0036DF14E5
MNLDFSAEPLFSWYVVLLAVSGIAMVVLGAVNLGGSLSIGWRAINILAGVAFAGYAYYLAFVFEGGEYRLFFQAFILPVALIANSVKALATRGSAQAAQPAPQQFGPPPTPYNPNAQYNPNAPYQAAPATPPQQPAQPPQAG